MSQQESKSDSILYEDQNVKITDQSVKVLKFYFPQDSKNEICFKDISKVGLKEMDTMDETLGVDPSFFQDLKTKMEQNKNMYIQMAVKDQSVRLSFAPEQPDKVLKLIQKKWEDAKLQMEKNQTPALQQNTLYNNVEVTPQKIQKAMQEMKKSEQTGQREDIENERKRDSSSPSRRQAELEQGKNPKKKIKQNDEKEREKEKGVNQENRNPNIEIA